VSSDACSRAQLGFYYGFADKRGDDLATFAQVASEPRIADSQIALPLGIARSGAAGRCVIASASRWDFNAEARSPI
jgi:hypothetical protein